MQFGSDSPTSFPTFRQQEGKWKKQKKNMNYLIDVLNILRSVQRFEHFFVLYSYYHMWARNELQPLQSPLIGTDKHFYCDL